MTAAAATTATTTATAGTPTPAPAAPPAATPAQTAEAKQAYETARKELIQALAKKRTVDKALVRH